MLHTVEVRNDLLKVYEQRLQKEGIEYLVLNSEESGFSVIRITSSWFTDINQLLMEVGSHAKVLQSKNS